MLRKLPVYIVEDGCFLPNGKRAINVMIEIFKTMPYALEALHLSVIQAGNKPEVLMPLGEWWKRLMFDYNKVTRPNLERTFRCLHKRINTEVVKDDPKKEMIGGWKPIVFLVLCQEPENSPWENEIKNFLDTHKCQVYLIYADVLSKNTVNSFAPYIIDYIKIDDIEWHVGACFYWDDEEESCCQYLRQNSAEAADEEEFNFSNEVLHPLASTDIDGEVLELPPFPGTDEIINKI